MANPVFDFKIDVYGDKISELELQVEPLREQAEKAKLELEKARALALASA